MERLRESYQAWIFPFGMVVTSAALFLTSLHSFSLLHVLTELFGIVIAFGIFTIAWSSRKYIDNIFLLLLGVSYFFVGALDLVHMIAHGESGVVIKNVNDNLPAQLWIASQYLEAVSIAVALILFQEKNTNKFFAVRKKSHQIFLSYLGVFYIIIIAVFIGNFLPAVYENESGLTSFGMYNEYVVALMLLGSLGLLFKKRKMFNHEMANMLSIALIIKVLAELLLAKFIGMHNFYEVLGHLFHFIFYLLLYKAILEGGLMRPYEFLFSDLKKSEDRYRSLVEFSPDAIVVHNSGKIIYANEPARKLFGIETVEMLIGMDLVEFFGSEYREQIRLRIKNIFSGKWREAPTMEMEVLHVDGKLIPVEVKGMKIIYEKQEVVESIIRDVSARKEAEEKLERVQSELRKKVEEQLTESYKHLGLVNRKISLLLEMDNHAQSKENKQEIVEYILSSLLSLSYANVGLLYLAVGANHFNLVSSAGLEKEKFSKLQIISEGSADFIKHLQVGKRVNGSCELVDAGCFNDGFELSYFVALPILLGSNCKGFLFLGFADRKSMDVQELEFLDVFAKHVSSALTNAGILS